MNAKAPAAKAAKLSPPGSSLKAGKTGKKKSILVLHGPNLNLLGSREPEHYGRDTLAQIDARLQQRAAVAKAALVAFQSNAESALVDRIHQAAQEGVDFILRHLFRRR